MSPSRSAVLALFFAAASWGFGTIISKRAVDEIPPMTLLAIQLGASVITVTLFRRRRSRRSCSGSERALEPRMDVAAIRERIAIKHA